ncbi:DUF3301 domain-containing protein [Aliikangiella coralliicola]|uniref:DUF3301 domain-containing protein n=1 Tax=Aliikangiella coralliicola TaxID=2592383 RepID=A0A545UHK4_9GAMM|nr:DUF3301 domain-containing protein [Aliikangiella coralliicola]TQV88957.1 DUF3301 domain-containing protein [Aliikangiella coralliicola]
MSKVFGIIALALVAYYWAYTQKLKQLAVSAGRQRCQKAGVQFLDHTVVQNGLKLNKGANGRWGIYREYIFDFTSTGEQRYQGKILLLGQHIVSTELEPFSIN